MRLLVPLLVILVAGCADPVERGTVILGATTSMQDAGILEVLLPAFENDTEIHVQAVIGGTGEILEKGKRGDLDVMLTHSPAREKQLVSEGLAASRRPVMFNLLALAGPASDPSRVADAPDAIAAFTRINGNASAFVSRGDESGTHEKELAIWQGTGLDVGAFSTAWYKETGTGQGATLLFASERDAYTLVDQPTLARYHAQGKATSIVDLFHEGEVMRNQYGVTLPNASRIPVANAEGARAFADWLTSARGQAAVASYEISGQRLYTPNADDAEA